MIIEDDLIDAEYLLRILQHSNDDFLDTRLDIDIRDRYSEALSTLREKEFDLILLDLNLPDVPNIQHSIHTLRSTYPYVPLIVMTGLKDKEQALISLRNGAQDYLIKGETTPGELRRSITYAIERHRLKSKLEETVIALEQKSSILRSILNHMGDGVIVMDRSGKLTMFNSAAAKMVDLVWSTEGARNRLEEHSVFDPLCCEAIFAPDLPVSPALQGEHVDDAEMRVISPESNEERYISVTARPIDDHSHSFSGCVAVLHDITQRRNVEKLKDEFVSVVSHELRTPLTSISGSLRLLLGGVTGILPVKTEEMISIAHRNSERLIRLINDLLDIQKLEAGKLELDLQPVQVSTLIAKGIELNKGYAQKHGVTFSFSDYTSEDLLIQGDEHWLQQVLANLLSNAAKFSNPGDSVVISLKKAPLKKVQVNVTDQGPGVPEEFHASIFEKFSQADSSTTRQKGGTGLGLNICKSIIELHQGEIGFSSVRGGGATFYFTLSCL